MKDRIEFVIQSAKIKKVDFAKRLSISQAFVSQMCSGTAKPSDRTITDICREFGCNEIWLRTGEGEPFPEETSREKIMRFAARTVKGSKKFRVALVEMLADLDDAEWDGLENLLTKLLDQYQKD